MVSPADAVAESPDSVDPADEADSSKDLTGFSPTRISLRRLRQDRVAMTCAIIVGLLLLLAIFADVINETLKISATQSGPYALDNVEALDAFNLPVVGPPGGAFTWDHPLGIAPNTATDNLARLLLGLRTSLLIATVASVVSTIIGV